MKNVKNQIHNYLLSNYEFGFCHSEQSEESLFVE